MDVQPPADPPSRPGPEEAAHRHAQVCLSVHERYPLLGLARAHHRNRRGLPITFLDKPSLIPLYAELLDAPEASFCKGVQTGITELLIQLMLYNAGWRNRICAYVLPQYNTSERFVDERINPLLVEVPVYTARTPGEEFGTTATQSKGNLKRKRFGRLGSLLFLGANTPADFVEFSADCIIVDEWDKCIASPPGKTNLAKVRDRVRESAYPQIFRVANPEYTTEHGIQRFWKDGSRGKWFHRCTCCGERQPLVWDEHFVRRKNDGTWEPRDTARANAPELGDLRPICRRCKKPWDREAAGGVWVHEAPFAARSYHMSRLDVLATTRDTQPIRRYFAEWIVAQQNTANLSAFYTGVLGWAYEAAGSRITQEMLERAAVEPPNDHVGGDGYKGLTVIMGVDVGAVLNVKLSVLEPDDTMPGGYRRRGRYVCTVPEFEDIYRIIDAFHVDACVIDAAPETRKAKEVRDHYIDEGTCDVWLCRYHPTSRVGRDAFGLRLDYDDHTVTVDRTQLLDATLDEIARGQATLPNDVMTVLGFADQMKAPVRVLDPESQRIVWREGNDPDHFRHADAYERVAQEIADRGGGYFEG
jgi:hypothetical protein